MRDIRIAAAVTRCPVNHSEQNLERMVRWIKAASSRGADVICFPELNVTGYWNHKNMKRTASPIPGAVSKALVEMASREKITVLAGMAETAEGDCIYASHLVVKPDGTIGVYRKLHIAPPEKPFLKPADTIPMFDLNGVRFGIQLCYDAHFPELTTTMALYGADLVFIPHASPRGTPEEKFTSWSRHLPARAFDNGLYVITCNQTGDNGKELHFPGVAMIIGPSGEILDKDITGQEGLLVADLTGEVLARTRNHKMRYFLPNRREDLYPYLTAGETPAKEPCGQPKRESD